MRSSQGWWKSHLCLLGRQQKGVRTAFMNKTSPGNNLVRKGGVLLAKRNENADYSSLAREQN